MKQLLLTTIASLIVLSCTHSRMKRYQDILDPLVGMGNRQRVAAALGGQPVSCAKDIGAERCEYRTLSGRNTDAPAVHAPAPGFGPNLAPYEYFDVIHVYFNEVGIVKEWQPSVLKD